MMMRLASEHFGIGMLRAGGCVPRDLAGPAMGQRTVKRPDGPGVVELMSHQFS